MKWRNTCLKIAQTITVSAVLFLSQNTPSAKPEVTPLGNPTTSNATSPGCSGPGQTLTQVVTKLPFSWTFSQPVCSGTYLNQDPWVLVQAGTSVVLIAISPAPQPGRNGSRLDPTLGQQCYDQRISNYNSATYNPSLCITLPLTLTNLMRPVSLVSTESWMDTATEHTDFSGNSSLSYTKAAAVLTFVPTIPAPYSFRPGYAGSSKEQFTAFDINPNAFSPLQNNSYALPNPTTLERLFSGVFLECLGGWSNRFCKPTDWMRDYGQFIAGTKGEALLYLLHQPLADPALLVGALQDGIDLYELFRVDAHYAEPNGGQMHGRLMLFSFASRLFENSHPNMLNLLRTTAPLISETGQTYAANSALGTPFAWRKYFGYTATERHPAQWTLQEHLDARYFYCCAVYDSNAVIGKVLGMDGYWPHEFFDWVNLYYTIDWRWILQVMNQARQALPVANPGTHSPWFNTTTGRVTPANNLAGRAFAEHWSQIYP